MFGYHRILDGLLTKPGVELVDECVSILVFGDSFTVSIYISDQAQPDWTKRLKSLREGNIQVDVFLNLPHVPLCNFSPTEPKEFIIISAHFVDHCGDQYFNGSSRVHSESMKFFYWWSLGRSRFLLLLNWPAII